MVLHVHIYNILCFSLKAKYACDPVLKWGSLVAEWLKTWAVLI